ncbi:MAG: protein kinase [Rubritalea sp.]|uniref:protein kinase domain-containing protein n=1 Tax=Rubritalea sp. TaxID=2109375 RepID=UPI0032421119
MSDDNSHQPLEFSPPSLELLTELLPTYTFEKLIAKGGMGAVYKANQTSLDRPVAVKVLPPELGESETFRESFVKEAKLMARLNHPNLISVFDFGEIKGMLYIVMEFVDGVTLYEKIYANHLEQQDALKTIIAICRGLANAHDAGILHRDIKPANIFITESGIPKIGDFGLARPSGDTETGVIFGTPGYTAPEVLNARDLVGPATDVFAVGVMLYELLAGKIPGDIYEPITKYSKCDPMIDRLIRKAVSPQLEQRYSSSKDFADDLDDIFRKAKKSQEKISSSPLLARQTKKASKIPASLATKPSGELANLVTSASIKTKTKAGQTTKRGVHSPPKTRTTSGGNNALNFIIIIILLAAIYVVIEWKDTRKAVIARIEKQNAEIEKLEINQPQPKSAQLSEPEPGEFDPKKVPVAKKITTVDATGLLRTRQCPEYQAVSEMQKTAIALDNGERLALFIKKELTWHQAQRWAEEHGAQLATIGSSSDLLALRKAIPPGENAWIGAATAGNQQWAWTDGTPWNDAIEIRQTSKLSFAQLDSDMFATAKKSTDTANFLIEWRADSSQPAALRKQMERVATTLDNSIPLYPAGSVTFASRNYFLCSKALTLSQAIDLAKSAGAQIATPSDNVEMAYYNDLISANVPSGKLCRIGGILDNNQWKWLSGEEWNSAAWDNNFPKEQDSIAIISSSSCKWRDVSQDRPVAYTLFEWSKDALTDEAITPTKSNSQSASELAKLQSKAATLVKDAHEKSMGECYENMKRLKWDLEIHFKGLSSNDKARQAFSIQQIKKLINGKDRIKKTVSGMGNSRKVQKITTAAYDKQTRIETAYKESIGKIRLIYQKKLRTLIKELESKGQLTAAKQAQKALRSSSTGINSFIQLFE